MLTGGCHCGAVRYEVTGEPMHHALCHCEDCRRHAGVPMVGWAMFDLSAHIGTLLRHSSFVGR